MADGLGIEWTGEENVLEFYAALKGIPLWKVLRNAGRDVIKGAWLATPKANKLSGPSPWAFLPRGGRYNTDHRGVYVYIPAQSEKTQERISKYRLAGRRVGYALATFIPVMRDLGFKQQRPPKSGNQKLTLGAPGTFFQRKIKSKSRGKPSSNGQFASGIEQFRRSHTDARTPDDYSYALINPDTTAPWVAITVKEHALRNVKYRNWDTKALSAGMERAARITLKDLTYILQHPEKFYRIADEQPR